MRDLCLFLLVCTFFQAGCSDGLQKGKVAVSGERSRSFKAPSGTLMIVRGHALTADHQPIGPESPLLCFVLINRGIQARGCDFQSTHLSYESAFQFNWQFADSADISLDASWDRRTDVVEINGNAYNRADGNVLMLVLESNERIAVRQVCDVSTSCDPFELLEDVQKKAINEKVIQELELVPADEG